MKVFWHAGWESEIPKKRLFESGTFSRHNAQQDVEFRKHKIWPVDYTPKMVQSPKPWKFQSLFSFPVVELRECFRRLKGNVVALVGRLCLKKTETRQSRPVLPLESPRRNICFGSVSPSWGNKIICIFWLWPPPRTQSSPPGFISFLV